MNENKIKINLNNYIYDDDMAYVAIGLNGGYIVKNYLKEYDSIFSGNYAFWNILFNYLKEIVKNEKYGFYVKKSVSTITFSAKNEEVIDQLNNLLDVIFTHEYSEKRFNAIKESTIESFRYCYKHEDFRAQYKAYEFSDLHKNFYLKELINDLKNITFEVFENCVQNLLVLGNVYVYISGNEEKIDFTKLISPKSNNQNAMKMVGYQYDPYLREDKHIIDVARKDYNLSILSFEFLNQDINNEVKQLIIEVFSELISATKKEISIDPIDASILIENNELINYKQKFKKISNEEFIDARNTILYRYITMMKNKPDYYVFIAVNYWVSNIFIERYLEILDCCSYEAFNELCKKSDYIISEAQIVLRRVED